MSFPDIPGVVTAGETLEEAEEEAAESTLVQTARKLRPRYQAALLGWIRGGVGAAAILTCMFFSTISGSSSAPTAAVGSTMIPAMVKKGYPKPFAAATVAFVRSC